MIPGRKKLGNFPSWLGRETLDKYLGVIRCGSRAIWAKNCKCTSRESGGGWQQRRCSIGGWRREGNGGGERWSEHPCLISRPLCPRDTSHLKFKRLDQDRAEVVKLKFKFPVEVRNKSGGKLGG